MCNLNRSNLNLEKCRSATKMFESCSSGCQLTSSSMCFVSVPGVARWSFGNMSTDGDLDLDVRQQVRRTGRRSRSQRGNVKDQKKVLDAKL